MNKRTARILTMAMGIITALVVVFSQVFFFQASTYAKKEVKSGQEKKQDKQGEDSSYITLPSISQSSTSTHVETGNESVFLLEILFEDNEEPDDQPGVSLSLGKFFHTMFRVIISPNAP